MPAYGHHVIIATIYSRRPIRSSTNEPAKFQQTFWNLFSNSITLILNSHELEIESLVVANSEVKGAKIKGNFIKLNDKLQIE